MGAYYVPGIFMDFIWSWLEPYERSSLTIPIDGRGNLRTTEVRNLPKLTELISNRMGTWTQVCLTPELHISQQDTGGWLWEQGADQHADQPGWRVWAPLNRLHGPRGTGQCPLHSALSSITWGETALFDGAEMRMKWGNTRTRSGRDVLVMKAKTGGTDEGKKRPY